MSDKQVSVIIRALDATASGLDKAKSRIQSWSSSVSGMLAGALAGFSLGAFGSRAVDELTGAERAVSQLGNSLANIGVDFQKVKPDIDAAIGSLQKVAAIDDDDAIASLNRLVQLSGDYRESLANLPLVADVAAAKNIDLADAAERVGKIMAGTGAKALKDFGITTKDTTEAIEQLRAKVKGAAETELRTLDGSLKAANIGFGDVAQAAADVVAGSPGFQKFMRDGIHGLQDLGTWLGQNKVMLQGWLATLFAGVKETAIAISHLVGVAVNAVIATNAAGQAIATMFAITDKGKARNAEANLLLRTALTALHEDLSYDLSGAWDRVANASKDATEAQVGGLKRTRDELAKNKAAHDAIVAQQRAEAAEAARKEREKQQSALDQQRDARVGDLEKAAELPKYRVQAVAGLHLMESAVTAELKNQELSFQRQLVLADRLARIKAALAKVDPAMPTAPTLAEIGDRAAGSLMPTKGQEQIDQQRLEKQIDQTAAAVTIDTTQGPDLDFGQRLGLSIESSVGKGEGALLSLSQTLADITAGPIMGFGDAVANSMQALVSGSGSAAKAFKDSMIGAVSAVAAQKGKLFAGEALGALGAGFLGHPGAFAAAAKYGLAATLMFALAGAAGGLTSGGSGGGGSTPAQAGAATQASLAGVGQGNLSVVVKGKNFSLDANDAEQQDSFIAMIKKVAGNRQIDIRYES